ncbi:MAG: glycyl-radical enzyme activating protein [Deltaproteobacteria bacterium]|nr:glycyl-radical enzyme activating protein [Deltaproteobacteria bacterium]
MSPRPAVVDVKRSSLDDGPGIRSVVFFKGCPLRCVWCQNPETLAPRPEVQRSIDACIGCRACVAACPVGRARPAAEAQPDVACRLCGACVEACPAAARRIAGTEPSIDELVELLLRDDVFYRRSGGGVTLSGGEPALFPEFVGEVAGRLHARGVHVLAETCGQFRWEAFAAHLLPHVSTVYFDLKIADPERHRRWVGRDNETIHHNFRRLAAAGTAEVLPRIPLVPSLTDDRENLLALAALIRSAGLGRVALLPYNPLWVTKRRALGLDMPYGRAEWMNPDEVARCEEAVAGAGLEVIH